MGPPLGLLSILVLAGGALAEEEYHYDTSAVKTEEKKGGQRLVGADAGQHKKMPFLVAWNGMPSSPKPMSSCTGSLITSQWLVSAAHCTEYIQKENRDALNEECIAKTERGEEFRNNRGTVLKCRRLKNNNLEISPISPKGVIWVGVNDVGNDEDVANGFSTTIEKIIRHVKSYKGGGNYGTYGGYDITLVRIDQPVPSQFGRTACLPTSTFDDSRTSSLAGYGRYFRDNGDTCMTDEYGKYKFHYCKDSGSGDQVCRDGQPQQNPVCQKFLTEVYKPAEMEQYEDFAIITANKQVMCFHPNSVNPKSKGWCETKDDYYGFTPVELPEGPQNWGFCSKDCYLNTTTEKPAGVLRVAPTVDVLPDDLCDLFLKAAMPQGAEVQPHVLCVGKLREFRTDVWTYDGTTFARAGAAEKSSFHHMGDKLGNGKYVSAAGTCNGDSGGPIFIQEDKNTFVVTGVVSGGRGLLGKCGGVNNPTHYVRLKFFAKWIALMLGDEANQLCWHKSFQENLNKARRQRRI